MITKNTRRRNGILLLATGSIMLILAIYSLVTGFEQGSTTWYYWFLLVLVGDILIISGVRQLKARPKQ
ncbi:MAG: hypothetical protein ACPGQR_00750 [Marinirhabdus sp.]